MPRCRSNLKHARGLLPFRYKRDKAAAMRRIERRMKRQEEIQRKKEAAETRAALVLEEDAARKVSAEL